MRDVVAQLDRWSAAGRRSAIATVVAVKRSAPRPPGSKMAVAADGAVEGALSGGCVEEAVARVAAEVLDGGAPRLLSFEIADEEAWAVGRPCGGDLEVWVDLAEGPAMDRFAALAREGGRGALVTRTDTAAKLLVGADGEPTGTLGGPELDAAAVAAAEEVMWEGGCRRLDLLGVSVLVDATAPPPRLVVVGAVDLAAALCRLARAVGWEPSVADPRPRFATRARFPAAEHVLAAAPAEAFAQLAPLDRDTAVAVLTHDPEVDDPALELALRSGAGYVGAMGSRRTQAARSERLLERGLMPEELERLAAPIGLDLGALTPEETALSVIAEIAAVRRGRAGGRLTHAAGAIREVSR